MEQDRFQQNSKLFIIGIIALLMSLSLFAFSFYILPYLLWNWVYDVPGFILTWREWFKEEYNYTNSEASWLVFLIFIIPAVICGYISYYASNYIDNRIHGIAVETPEENAEITKEVKATVGLSIKIALLLILVLIIVSILQWIFAIPLP